LVTTASARADDPVVTDTVITGTVVVTDAVITDAVITDTVITDAVIRGPRRDDHAGGDHVEDGHHIQTASGMPVSRMGLLLSLVGRSHRVHAVCHGHQ
jgi:hypothetical protein